MSGYLISCCRKCFPRTSYKAKAFESVIATQSRLAIRNNSSAARTKCLSSPTRRPVKQPRLSSLRASQQGFSRLAPHQHVWMMEMVDEPYDPTKLVLTQDNLFHTFSKSPIPAIRKRAAYIKQHAYCPHPTHRRTRMPVHPDDPENEKPISSGAPPAHVNFECPDCGIPVYCSEEHWADHYEEHVKICNQLREINEDDHDLHSGRYFFEFHYPGYMIDEALVNFLNWDTFAYTRGFNAMDDMRNMRQATKLLTYPITIGSILHELSPYNGKAGGRMTMEGLKSFSGKHVMS